MLRLPTSCLAMWFCYCGVGKANLIETYSMHASRNVLRSSYIHKAPDPNSWNPSSPRTLNPEALSATQASGEYYGVISRAGMFGAGRAWAWGNLA